ncbi:MAG TPA: hypothetical protein VF765_33115 [Polyangiaceae bacterium]
MDASRVEVVVLLVAALVSSCSFMSEQVGISSASTCIQKQCQDPDAQDRIRCEAACRARYVG